MERRSTGSAGRLAFALPSLLLLTLVVSCGCSSERSASDYIPPAERSRSWLEQALTKWRDGRAESEFGSAPKIQFGDTEAQAGRKLVEFSILGELPVDSGRRFQVRLTFDDPPETQKRQYVVVGIDPIWVVDQESLNMITHWDHKMTPPPSTVDPAEKAEATDDRTGKESGAPPTTKE